MLKYLWVHPGLNEITDSFRQDFSEPLKCQRRLSIEQRKVSAAFPRFLAIELPLLSPLLTLSRSFTLVKSECSDLPKYILPTPISASCCFLSNIVQSFPFKILPSLRWTFQVLQPRGKTPLGKLPALCLSLMWGPSVVTLHYHDVASSALLPTPLYYWLPEHRPGSLLSLPGQAKPRYKVGTAFPPLAQQYSLP